MGGAGVFADVGQAFLQDENHLELLVLCRQERTVFPNGFDRYPGLLREAREQVGNSFGKFFIADFGTEIEQQFADIFITFLHACFDKADVFCGFLPFVFGKGGFQHLYLQVQEG